MSRSAHLVAVAVALALSACNGEDQGGADSERPSRAADRTPLERRDAAPTGVAEQVSYFEVGNGGCPEADQPEIRFLGGFPREHQAPIGQTFTICVNGFMSERPVQVNVRRSDGREVARRVPFDRAYGLHVWRWKLLPGDPLGSYQVTATQGATTVNASFTVRLAPFPRVWVLDDYVRPGTPVRVSLTGFPPREAVRLHLYRARRAPSGRFSYLTSITANTDQRGEALRRFPTDRGVQRDKYLVRVNKQLQDAFQLGEPPRRDSEG